MPVFSELPVGAKVKFGSYAVRGQSPHQICWWKAHHDGTLLTEYLEEQFPFDAAEPKARGQRAEYGSNRYSKSNIRYWLNSTGENWFVGATPTDEAPTDDLVHSEVKGSDKKPGFLSSFSEWELNALELTELKCIIPEIDRGEDGPEIEMVRDYAFIPSVQNLISGFSGGAEGELFELFESGFTSIPNRMSTQLYEESEDKPSEPKDGWWAYTRTPKQNDGSTVAAIGRNRERVMLDAHDAGIGAMICVRIKPDTAVSEERDENGYMHILEAPEVAIEINECDYLDIIYQNKNL